MESNPLRGLFGVSSPRPVEPRVAPQPTEPIENETPFDLACKEQENKNKKHEIDDRFLTSNFQKFDCLCYCFLFIPCFLFFAS